jgi:hypothetical protein
MVDVGLLLNYGPQLCTYQHSVCVFVQFIFKNKRCILMYLELNKFGKVNSGHVSNWTCFDFELIV